MTDRASGESAVLSLQNEGPGCVVLTMGSGGVLYTLPREERNGDDSVSVHHVPAEPVNVVDTTVRRLRDENRHDLCPPL